MQLGLFCMLTGALKGEKVQILVIIEDLLRKGRSQDAIAFPILQFSFVTI
mgnify:CR=1 FL=1